ncbi:inositol monophosphatase family protein [Methylophaga sp. OBS4]|uniref:inositol monophosphatase family protein n=1 Tax=Methylophaga sp. OBS4 TaxID=2991935 RepID=UPI002257245E|nr:inositol monophosphatase family protein [Methylophaga sp. OBS4]MCX4187632.1 inositol monophosphatase family protein [Methylophaga sp. OBS4]
MEIDLRLLQRLVRDVVDTTLLPQFNNVKRQYKKDGSIVTIADQAMQHQLTAALAEAYPDIALLGEEMPLQQQQQLLDSGQLLWCLDPIDGTSNFASGLPFFSISLALIENGQVSLGLVYDPIMDESFTAKIGQGAWLNDVPLQAEQTGLTLEQSIALIDFKRLPATIASRLVSERPFGSQRSLGSVALELCWIAAGRAQLYLHGGQQLWDYAAAQLIIAEAGAYACTLEGEALFTNSLQQRSTCAAVDKALFDSWRSYLDGLPG